MEIKFKNYMKWGLLPKTQHVYTWFCKLPSPKWSRIWKVTCYHVLTVEFGWE
jgi:hypothetical protein